MKNIIKKIESIKISFSQKLQFFSLVVLVRTIMEVANNNYPLAASSSSAFLSEILHYYIFYFTLLNTIFLIFNIINNTKRNIDSKLFYLGIAVILLPPIIDSIYFWNAQTIPISYLLEHHVSSGFWYNFFTMGGSLNVVLYSGISLGMRIEVILIMITLSIFSYHMNTRKKIFKAIITPFFIYFAIFLFSYSLHFSNWLLKIPNSKSNLDQVSKILLLLLYIVLPLLLYLRRSSLLFSCLRSINKTLVIFSSIFFITGLHIAAGTPTTTPINELFIDIIISFVTITLISLSNFDSNTDNQYSLSNMGIRRSILFIATISLSLVNYYAMILIIVIGQLTSIRRRLLTGFTGHITLGFCLTLYYIMGQSIIKIVNALSAIEIILASLIIAASLQSLDLINKKTRKNQDRD